MVLPPNTNAPAIAEAKALGLQVRALRQAKGWTLEEAAEKGAWMKHWQKDRSWHPSTHAGDLVRIAEGLGETVGSLFARCRAKVRRSK